MEDAEVVAAIAMDMVVVADSMADIVVTTVIPALAAAVGIVAVAAEASMTEVRTRTLTQVHVCGSSKKFLKSVCVYASRCMDCYCIND